MSASDPAHNERVVLASASIARGRPRLHSDEEILDVALKAFAAQGYDAVSIRSLNAGLGLSHGTISQRFGTKQRLYFAAVEHGFVSFFAEIEQERQAAAVSREDMSDLAELRILVLSFLLAAWKRPELGRLMNQEGLEQTDRLEFIIDLVFKPVIAMLDDLLGRLEAARAIRRTSRRSLFFLVAHGAEAPFTLTALSQSFDGIDGPLDPKAHAEAITDLIMAGLTSP